jgi:hypothetical protein
MQSFETAFNFGTNLIDNWISQNLATQQAKLNLQASGQRAREIDQTMAINQQKADQAQRLYPLELQGEQQKLKITQFNLDSAQQQMDQNNKAYEQVGPLRDAIKGIDKDDPDFDQKIADLENKYPDAFTSKATASMVVPFINDLSQRRSVSSKFQLAQSQKESLKSHIQNGYLPATVNPDDAVASGQAQQYIDAGNRQAATQRIQTAMPYMKDPTEQRWAQNEIQRINGGYGGGGESIPADPTAMTPKGQLNPASDAVMSSIERKYNLVAKPPGPTKDITTKQYDAQGNVLSTTTVKGVQATAADQTGASTTQPQPVTTGTPSTDKIISSKAFQGVMSDVQSGKLKMPDGMVLTSPEGRAWLKGEYLKRAVETGEQVPGTGDIPGAAPEAEPAGPTAPAKKKSNGLSVTGSDEAGQFAEIPTGGANTGLETLQPDFASKVQAWEQGMREAGYNPQITQAGRSPAYQEELYQKHLAGGPLAAKPQNSFHSYGRAFDWANVGPDGKLQENNDAAYKFGQQLASKYGLRGLGDADNDHLEDAAYTTGHLPQAEYGRIRGGGQAPASGIASSGNAATGTSNNDYALPEGAGGKMGIPAHVWQNVMSEEGAEVGQDGSHPSVFGLWGDKGGMEGAAYRRAVQSGPRSLAAYNAVTNTWINNFLPQSQPWKLQSPGMQELVIADSQHRGGDSARSIIDAMGGWNAVNSMDPQQAIATYSELRKPLWPANEARVTRERDWALRNALPQEAGQLAQR